MSESPIARSRPPGKGIAFVVAATAAVVVLFGVYVFVFHIQAWWALWDLVVS